MQRVCEGVYRLESAGFVNAYLLIGGADLTLVDAGPDEGWPVLAAELKDNGYDPKAIARVVITHAHAAHAGGLEGLLAARPVKVLAHPAEIPALTGKAPAQVPGGVARWLHAAGLRARSFRPVPAALPLVAGATLRGVPQWQVLHTPGHTSGSISLYHPGRQVLLCGDALSNRGGRLHVPGKGRHQDSGALKASVEALARLDCDVLCPGHGPIVRGGAFRHIEKLAGAKD